MAVRVHVEIPHTANPIPFSNTLKILVPFALIEDGERTDLTDIMRDIENDMSFYDLSKEINTF